MGDEFTKTLPAGLLRRLAALLYDLLLVTALAFVATFAMLPLTHGEAILTATQGLVGRIYHALIFSCVFAYFGWCWTRTGQTLGMKAWRLRLESDIGGRLGWRDAIARFLLGTAIAVLAVLGIWYLRTAGSALAHAGAALLVAPALVNYGWIHCDAAGRSLLEIAGSTRVLRVG